jgi:hypothetical protein
MLLTNVVGQKADEYHVKAAFLCNFANFVEWPPSTYRSPSDPLTVCVLGRNPFGNVLESLTAGRSVDGHPFAVRYETDVRQVGGCQILFVSASERLRYRSILDAVKTSSVLSVGDSSDFIAEGGVVDLRLESGKVRVEIDAQAARQRNLHVSAHLLGLAKVAR